MPTDQATLPLENESSEKPKIGNFRWVICALIFFGTTLNYVDRQVLSLVAHDVQVQYHVSKSQYGWITATFSLCYATGQLAAGGWLDRVGTRLGYAVALAAWSAASMLHALARSAFGFGVARAFLGVSESPAYPAATKVMAEWLPKRERALGMGIVNAGSNLGALVVPIVVPWIVVHHGLNAAFMITGAAGLHSCSPGFRSIAGPRITRAFLPPNLPTFRVIRRNLRRRFHGLPSGLSRRRGHLSQANSSRIPSGRF